jgi:hypothetical protein
MPTPDLSRLVEQFRTALLSRERANAVRLINAYGEAYRRLLPDIQRVQDELTLMPEPTAGKLMRLARYKALKRRIEDEIGNYGVIADHEINQGARVAITAGGTQARAMTQAALPGLAIDAQIMAQWSALPAGAVESLLAFMQPGSPLRASLASNLGAAAADQFESDLANALARGFNPARTARIIRDSLGQGLNWSLRVARTTQVYAYREATRASYLANDYVVSGWIWRCSKSTRTCIACIMSDGEFHTLDETLNDHWNGRCFPEPAVRSYAEMGLPIPDVPQEPVETGREWFEGLNDTAQRSMMGDAAYKAWQEGKLDLGRLVHEREDPVWGPMRGVAALKDIISQ